MRSMLITKKINQKTGSQAIDSQESNGNFYFSRMCVIGSGRGLVRRGSKLSFQSMYVLYLFKKETEKTSDSFAPFIFIIYSIVFFYYLFRTQLYLNQYIYIIFLCILYFYFLFFYNILHWLYFLFFYVIFMYMYVYSKSYFFNESTK